GGEVRVQRELVGVAAVDHEDAQRSVLLVPGGDGVGRGAGAEAGVVEGGGVQPHVEHLAAGVLRGQREGVEGGLLPAGAAGLGHDRGDHVDQLGEGGGGDAVAVPQQRDQQVAE